MSMEKSEVPFPSDKKDCAAKFICINYVGRDSNPHCVLLMFISSDSSHRPSCPKLLFRDFFCRRSLY